MSNLEFIFALSALILSIISTVGTLFAIRLIKNQLGERETKDVAIAIFALPETEQKTKAWAEAVMRDKMTVYLSEREFMPRELQERENSRTNERLEALETKVDNLPNAVSDRVTSNMKLFMLEIQRKSS